MTPKEKARELVDKFRLNVVDYEGSGLNDYKAKQCALIAVEEMLSNDGWSSSREEFNTFKNYFEEVKREIEKL
jgi:hypothetical protein